VALAKLKNLSIILFALAKALRNLLLLYFRLKPVCNFNLDRQLKQTAIDKKKKLALLL
jgi:hypothetical protein